MKGKQALIVGIALIVVGVVSRLLLHEWNFVALWAIAIFAAAYYKSIVAMIAIPVSALLLSDLVLNNTIQREYFAQDKGVILWGSYIWWSIFSIVLIVFFAYKFLKKVRPLNLLGVTLGSTLIFFLISNFGVWLGSVHYAQSLSGLISCYEMGLPFFFKGTLIGTVSWVIIIFGSYQFYMRKSGSLERAKA